jgi:hypothetical protein
MNQGDDRQRIEVGGQIDFNNEHGRYFWGRGDPAAFPSAQCFDVAVSFVARW